MRDTVSQPSLDIEESYFSKSSLFFGKNHLLFYYLKLLMPSFTDFRYILHENGVFPGEAEIPCEEKEGNILCPPSPFSPACSAGALISIGMEIKTEE